MENFCFNLINIYVQLFTMIYDYTRIILDGTLQKVIYQELNNFIENR